MILVLGATGTVGTTTVRALQGAGAKVKIGARAPEKAKALGVDAVRFDWEDFGSYVPAFEGAEKLYLLTPGSDRAHGYTMQAVAAAKRAGVKHIVRLSVIGADSEPGIALGRQHRACEKEIAASGIAWTFLRPTYFMQNFVNYYGVNPKQGGAVYLAHGDAKASYVDARDLGEVGAKVLTSGGHEGKSYELTGPAALSDAEAVAILSSALGHPYTYAAVPPEAAAQAMAQMGAPAWQIDAFAELDWVVREGHASGVTDGVKTVLGRDPTSFAQWASDLAQGKG